MKIAVITTSFLEEFVLRTLDQLRLPCEVSLFIYRDFSHVGALYAELEDKFDGFMISGPVPRQAIIKRVHAIKKPIFDFGTDLQSYYETFLQLIYRYNAAFDRGYFDLMDWCPTEKGLDHYLSTGSFGSFYTLLNERVSEMSLAEIAATEQRVLQKHIQLWEAGLIDFSTTRFSSIVPQLQAAGVNYFFIYPHIDFVKNAFDLLLQEVNLRRMRVNQTSAICITIKQTQTLPAPPECCNQPLNQLAKLLSSFNKEQMGDFKLQQTARGFEIFTSFQTLKKITDSFRACTLKTYLQERADFPVCIGYGIGNTLNQALSHAQAANTESNIHSNNSSFVVNEKEEIIGPLGLAVQLTVSNQITPYLLEISKKVKLSTLTLQKILSAIDALGTNEITPQNLATTLHITVRSANRFLSNLLQYGEAEISYERQNGSRGRPERVYKILFSHPN